jgi:hypothetical protein
MGKRRSKVVLDDPVSRLDGILYWGKDIAMASFLGAVLYALMVLFVLWKATFVFDGTNGSLTVTLPPDTFALNPGLRRSNEWQAVLGMLFCVCLLIHSLTTLGSLACGLCVSMELAELRHQLLLEKLGVAKKASGIVEKVD